MHKRQWSLTEHVAGPEALPTGPADNVEGPAAAVADDVGGGVRDLAVDEEAKQGQPQSHGTAPSLSHRSLPNQELRLGAVVSPRLVVELHKQRMAFYSHPTEEGDEWGGEGMGPFEVEKSTQLITFSLRWKQRVNSKRPTTPVRGQNVGPGSLCSDNLACRVVVEEKVAWAGERRHWNNGSGVMPRSSSPHSEPWLRHAGCRFIKFPPSMALIGVRSAKGDVLLRLSVLWLIIDH